MSEELDENTIKLLKYIILNSKNGNATISLKEINEKFGMSINEIQNILMKLEKMKAIKMENPLTTDFILKTLVLKAIEYDLMYLSEKIDEQAYKKGLEEISSEPSIKNLLIDKSCLTSNLVELKDALNNMEYLLQILNEIINKVPVYLKEDDSLKIINDLFNDFLNNLTYIYNFLIKLRLLGEIVLESLENFKKIRIEAKVITSNKIKEKYEDYRKDFIKKSQCLFILGSFFYPKAFHFFNIKKAKNRKCDTCKRDVQIDWKYCKFCGKKISKIFLPIYLTEKKYPLCPKCGAILVVENKACVKCGFNFIEEIRNVENTLLKLKEELELLNARRIIEGDALINDIRKIEAEYKDTELKLEELKKASQELEYVNIEIPKYLIINNIKFQKLGLILFKKITLFKDLISKTKFHIDEHFEELVKDILESEKEVVNYIMLTIEELPLSLQEYGTIIKEDKESLTCNSCGFKNDKDALFCIECGYSF